jgi:hypothetical protein
MQFIAAGDLGSAAASLWEVAKAQLILASDTTSPGHRPMRERSSADFETRLLCFCSIRFL